MKIKWYTLVFLFVLSPCWAQLGFELGVGHASLRGNKSVESYMDEGIWSPLIGVTYHVNLAILGVQPSIQIIQKGAQGSQNLGNNGGTIQYGISAWFVDIPLLLAIKPLPGLAILAGPVASVFLAGSLQEDALHRSLVEDGLDFTEYVKSGSKDLDRKNMNALNLSIAAGIQYMLPIFDLGIQCTYKRGLTDLNKKATPDLAMKTDFWGLSVLYLF